MTVQEALALGMKHFSQDDLNVAASIFRQILVSDPNHAEATHMLGLVFVRLGQHNVAAEYFQRAVAMQPSSAMLHCNLGTALATMDLLEPAEAALRRAIELQPEYFRALSNLGYVLQRRGNFAEAIDVFQKAHALLPADPQTLNDLGNAFRANDQLDEAIAKYRQAIQTVPTFPASYNNLAVALLANNQLVDAEKACRTALSYQPDLPTAHYNLGMSLLSQGKLTEGWKEYAWRKRVEDKNIICRDFPKPVWNGRDLAGKRVLIHAEQGLGDAIQFVRYLPMVLARGGKIILDCKPELIPLFQTNFELEQCVPTGEPIPPFDIHCPLLNLPMVFGTTLENIPATAPYLSATVDTTQRWRERLANVPGLKIGLAWAGSPTHEQDRKRSITPDHFGGLGALRGVSLISLQKGLTANKSPQTLKLLDFTGELSDFAETAGLIANLDLVVSVDTAVAHLAGAMGKPVWVLIPFNPDWRWMLERLDSPWYPRMKLFRQHQPHDWSISIRQVVELVRKSVRSGKSANSMGNDESAAGT
jgi:Flp pilus assembly protein TadD